MTTSSKVPYKPKRPRTAFNLFFKDQQQKIKAMNLDSSINAPKLISNLWKTKTPPSVRAFYFSLAAKDKFRYYQEKSDYEDHLKRREEESHQDSTSLNNEDLDLPCSRGNSAKSLPYGVCQLGAGFPPACIVDPLCTPRSIAVLAEKLDRDSIHFLIRAFK